MLRHIHLYKAVISRLQAGMRENDISEINTQKIAPINEIYGERAATTAQQHQVEGDQIEADPAEREIVL